MWTIFWEVNSDRPVGMSSPGRIPFSSIAAYADRYGIEDVDEFDRLKDQLREMDGEFLRIVTKSAGDADVTVDVNDVDGVKGLLSRLGARAEAEHGNKTTTED